jgi:hypothetical protein
MIRRFLLWFSTRRLATAILFVALFAIKCSGEQGV